MWVITTTKTTKYDERGKIKEVTEVKEERDVPIACCNCEKNKPKKEGKPKFGTELYYCP